MTNQETHLDLSRMGYCKLVAMPESHYSKSTMLKAAVAEAAILAASEQADEVVVYSDEAAGFNQIPFGD